MRRAYLEAVSFARERTAFGQRVTDFPLVRENLAVMKAEEAAALASTNELTSVVDRIDRGAATDDDVAWHRILVNANKYVTSLAATRTVRRGIEALGGNGAVEDFSAAPAAVSRRDRLRELGGHPQRPVRAGAARPHAPRGRGRAGARAREPT